jgi:hypothetical protein
MKASAKFLSQVLFMSKITLSQLHCRRVEVELDVNGDVRSMDGVGSYEQDPTLGQVLRIRVDDPAGEFWLLFPEARHTFNIQPSLRKNCDYRIDISHRRPDDQPSSN